MLWFGSNCTCSRFRLVPSGRTRSPVEVLGAADGHEAVGVGQLGEAADLVVLLERGSDGHGAGPVPVRDHGVAPGPGPGPKPRVRSWSWTTGSVPLRFPAITLKRLNLLNTLALALIAARLATTHKLVA